MASLPKAAYAWSIRGGRPIPIGLARDERPPACSAAGELSDLGAAAFLVLQELGGTPVGAAMRCGDALRLADRILVAPPAQADFPGDCHIVHGGPGLKNTTANSTAPPMVEQQRIIGASPRKPRTENAPQRIQFQAMEATGFPFKGPLRGN
jgi:hypothetical protein